MFDLVTLDQARHHLRVDAANETDAAIESLITIASGIVLTYVKAPEDAAAAQDVWERDTVPGSVQAATLLVLGDLYDHRQGEGADPLSDAVLLLLTPFRTPSLA